MASLLVLYASHEGQTRKILGHMVSQAAHWQVEWVELGDEPSRPLVEYDKILIGASIRYGHFPKALDHLVKHRGAQLNQLDAAFIGICLTARKPEKSEPHTNLYMRKWLARSIWHPRQCAVFAGALRYSRYTWWQTRIIQLIMWMTGGSTDKSQDLEFTDWNRVDHFTTRFLGAAPHQGLE